MPDIKEKFIQCLNCGSFNKDLSKFCNRCGRTLKPDIVITTGKLSKLKEVEIKCKVCQKPVNSAGNYCLFCGSRLKDKLEAESYQQTREDKTSFVIGKISDLGMRRDINEDSLSTIEFSIAENSKLIQIGLYLVSDGMGGANAGEVASQTAVRSINSYMINEMQTLNIKDFEKEISAIIKGAITNAHQTVLGLAKQDESRKGMGCTMVICVVKGSAVYIDHIGDSRCYYVTGKKIKQITEDHSLFNTLVKKGAIKKEDRENFKQKNVITNALGISIDIDKSIDSKVKIINMEHNEFIVMCSDGLTGHLEDKEIGEIVLKSSDPQNACVELVKLANQRGGKDNITVIIMKCVKK